MRKAYKIVFLGNTSVGKTTLISQYLYHKVQAATPTIGIDFLSTMLDINGRQVRLQLWDTAGQERFQSIIGNYTRNTFLAVVVYAVNDRTSLERVKSWIENFVLTHNQREDVRLLIVANKTDLEVEGFDPDYAEAREIAAGIGARFVTTSAISTEGIGGMATAISEFIAENLEESESEKESMGDVNTLKSVRHSRRCC